jgi:NADH dehydrogenase [ubiquinone] 1 alpha subcomplex assembly factor 7
MPSDPADSASVPLLAILRERIAREGPITVEAYMRACLQDPEHGYWQRAATLGADGDFITAPEISQVFGELIGLWAAVTWQTMGGPSPVRLVELGPGRGTLMRDALRAARASPDFRVAVSVHLVEMSAPLCEVQRQTLASEAGIAWRERLDEVPRGPAIIVANEFLDALPIRQLVFRDNAWRARVVELGPHGTLQFAIGAEMAVHTDLAPQEGAVLDLRPDEDNVLKALAARAEPFVALFIDYGPSESAFGDTLQAVSRHTYVDPLAAPGTADLTAHVQFSVSARKARDLGLAVGGPITQAEFLARLGIVERAQRLMAANPSTAAQIEAAVQRLVSPTGMGGLFKVLTISSPALPPPLPFG